MRSERIKAFDFFEDIDEDLIDSRNILSASQAKVMFDALKIDGYKNLVTKPDGSWMIEVE